MTRSLGIDELTDALADAERVIAQMEALIDAARTNLREVAEADESLGMTFLDTEQVQLYDLALSSAEVSAARVMTAYARQPAEGTDAAIKARLALAFSAEAATGISHRLRIRAADYGLSSEDFDDAPFGFSELHFSTEALNAVGQALIERGRERLPDHLDHEKSIIRDTFRAFADERVVPLAERVHREDLTIPSELIEGLKALGCFGLSIPERFGGLVPDNREDSLGMVVVTEELSRGSLGAAGSLITRPEILAQALMAGGTEAQRNHWLPRLASGAVLCAISVTEPSTGSDVASVALRAARTDGGWRLSGAKTWCTFAGKADVIMVLARTDPDALPAHRGLSLFLVEKPATDAHELDYTEPRGGRVTGRAIATLGYRGMHSFDMAYEDFFVPDDHLIGGAQGEGKGFYFTMRGFAGGRLQTAARACGLMQAAFDAALDYASERVVFGRPVADYPLTRAKLARMAAYLTACRQFSYAVAGMMDTGGGQMEASLVKLFACRMAEWVCREALQIHGGMGYAEECAVSRYYVDARVLSIFEGAEETLALRVVGKALIETA